MFSLLDQMTHQVGITMNFSLIDWKSMSTTYAVGLICSMRARLHSVRSTRPGLTATTCSVTSSTRRTTPTASDCASCAPSTTRNQKSPPLRFAHFTAAKCSTNLLERIFNYLEFVNLSLAISSNIHRHLCFFY